MEWIRAHPYAAGLAAAGLIVIAGALFVGSRVPAPPASTTSAWSGSPAISYATTTTESSQSPEQIAAEVIENQAPPGLALPGITSATSAPSVPTASSSFDYVALLAQIVASSSAPAASAPQNDSGSEAIAQAYQFLPQGLVATTAPAQAPMTPTQQTLYEYGNEVGGIIQSFERENSDEVQVLKNQANDRTDPTDNAALVSLAQSLASVGTRMQQMSDVPSSVSSLHTALAQSYQTIGGKLQLVAQAQSDDDFVQAIENYDSAADTFIGNYAALASYLSAQGVVFQDQDPGSVFSFSDSNAGL